MNDPKTSNEFHKSPNQNFKKPAHEYPTFRSDEQFEVSPQPTASTKFYRQSPGASPISDPEESTKILHFLVSKYDELDDKSEVEALILELNNINKSGGKISEEFRERLESFTQSLQPVRPNTANPDKSLNLLKSKMENRKGRQDRSINREKALIEEFSKDDDSHLFRTTADFMTTIQNNPSLLQEYQELVAEYEESRNEIKAKTLMKFKSSSSSSKIDNNIGVVLLYYFCQIDTSITLRNDKRQLEDKSWNFVKTYFGS